MAGRRNGSHGIEALLEKIVGEIRSMRDDMNGGFGRLDGRIASLQTEVQKLDARLDLMALGYRDLRDRVGSLEKPSA